MFCCLQGDGTRKGNGLCKCNSGYSNDNCDRCANNYFSVLENDTLICEKCHKSCKEGCTASGPKGYAYAIYSCEKILKVYRTDYI